MTKKQLEQFLKIQDEMELKGDIIFKKMVKKDDDYIYRDHYEYDSKHVYIIFGDYDSGGCCKSFPIELMLLEYDMLNKKLDEMLEEERQEIERKRLLKEEEDGEEGEYPIKS